MLPDSVWICIPGVDATLRVTRADAPVWIPTPSRVMDVVTRPFARAVLQGLRFAQ